MIPRMKDVNGEAVPCYCVGDCWPDGPCEVEGTNPCFACRQNCPECRGKGTLALHGMAITADEWNGPDWDDDMRDNYMAGHYDTLCEFCNGRGHVITEQLRELYEDRALFRAESGMMPGRDY